MALYLFSLWVVGVFLIALGIPRLGVYAYWAASLGVVSWLNLSFRLGWKRPFRLFPIFFGQFFFSIVTVLLIAGGLIAQSLATAHTEGMFPERLRETWPVVVSGLLLIILVSLFYRLKGPFVREISVGIPGLPGDLSGFRIVHLSDIHVGGFMLERDLARLRDMVMALDPDLLLITGDMIDHSLSEVSLFSSLFSAVTGRFGRFLVMGNHEQWIGGKAVSDAFTRNGFSLLENKSVRISVKKAGLWIVGLSDPAEKERVPGGGPDPRRAFEAVPDGEGDPVIVMAHQPDVWMALSGVHADLMLSGHTHGGQIGFFRSGWNLARLFHRLDIGLFQRVVNGRLQQLFVHGGLGYFGVPVRLGIRPEVVVLTLCPGTLPDESGKPVPS